MIRFDAFGRLVGVQRAGDRWRVVYIGADGTHREAPVYIPANVPEADLRRHIADTFHESATPDRPDVVRLDD